MKITIENGKVVGAEGTPQELSQFTVVQVKESKPIPSPRARKDGKKCVICGEPRGWHRGTTCGKPICTKANSRAKSLLWYHKKGKFLKQQKKLETFSPVT